MLGLEKGVIRLSDNHPDWANIYRAEEKQLWLILKGKVVEIQHIGSTSIPGTIAKPILDIGVLVKDLKELDDIGKILSQLSYTYRGDAGASGGHVFVKNKPGNIRTHILHVIEASDPQWKHYIMFRDYLNAHPEFAERYAEVKWALARKFPHDRGAYTKGKTAFVQEVLKLSETKNTEKGNS